VKGAKEIWGNNRILGLCLPFSQAGLVFEKKNAKSVSHGSLENKTRKMEALLREITSHYCGD
jgi:hypothetical protein